jgi:hypothetical protein
MKRKHFGKVTLREKSKLETKILPWALRKEKGVELK